ncbi:MAG: nucleotide pyrophosphohydrolase [Oscillospiraceae bacterium]|nr:nucleotide pyrophosphohydrolase [Oscillospiraceae bacterium]MBR2366309.1 nucleotide pyrophosphohydrolase [Oscillospiraceae bacterium]MBR3850417.1 nucleotide pyrophosphohydrolase [Oscillospiraceae bacterium]
MLNFKEKEHYNYADLVALVSFLRSEHGCQWDHAQTHASIRRNFLEEAYEVCEGIDLDDPAVLKEELGDVLLQVVFHADIERERGRFTVDDVCDKVCKKLIFRHPHLFSGGEAQDWDELKKKEKGVRSKSMLLDGVAKSLPALIRAEKLREKSGGEPPFPDAEQALAAYRASEASEDAANALGDLLLAVVGSATERELDSETALHRACDRFIQSVSKSEDPS